MGFLKFHGDLGLQRSSGGVIGLGGIESNGGWVGGEEWALTGVCNQMRSSRYKTTPKIRIPPLRNRMICNSKLPKK